MAPITAPCAEKLPAAMFPIEDWMGVANEPTIESADRKQGVRMMQWGVAGVLTHDGANGRKTEETQDGNDEERSQDRRRKECGTDVSEGDFEQACMVF